MLEIRGLKHLEFLNCNDVTGLFDTLERFFMSSRGESHVRAHFAFDLISAWLGHEENRWCQIFTCFVQELLPLLLAALEIVK